MAFLVGGCHGAASFGRCQGARSIARPAGSCFVPCGDQWPAGSSFVRCGDRRDACLVPHARRWAGGRHLAVRAPRDEQATKRRSVAGDQAVCRGGDLACARQPRPGTHELPAGEPAEDRDERVASGTDGAVGRDEMQCPRELVAGGDRSKRRPAFPCRRVLQRHELEGTVPIDSRELARDPAAERAVPVVQNDETSLAAAHDRDGTLVHMAGRGNDRRARNPLRNAAHVRRIRVALLAWFDSHGRAIDFRLSTDAYGILVGEVMAQQTQIARVEPAWRAFMARFPTPAALAGASLRDVLKAWSGLGYNRRAVNLQRAATAIVGEHAGRMPREVVQLERLPGVGPYTARAIAATAFGAPVGAVDTNVRRVLRRMLARPNGHGAVSSEADVQRAADVLVDPVRPADWTHALMDLGATICRGIEPACVRCPLRPWCGFARHGAPKPSVRQPRARATVRFMHTTRWLRGRLVERLVAAPEDEWLELAAPIGTHGVADVENALEALRRESLVERDHAGRVRLRRSTDRRAATAVLD
jgi:A/G-specific adenine glycosylase